MLTFNVSDNLLQLVSNLHFKTCKSFTSGIFTVNKTPLKKPHDFETREQEVQCLGLISRVLLEVLELSWPLFWQAGILLAGIDGLEDRGQN